MLINGGERGGDDGGLEPVGESMLPKGGKDPKSPIGSSGAQIIPILPAKVPMRPML
ncbi:unnamed protein product [Dovyalis caffra]|uniref:Uncharacterized protein n=1 Tax=Dovyalis caffra TaxID=77055 RepID=A0AAV1R9R2_9ROSI|nr:unnamed protein product [Dovyalis caffra]